MPPSRSRQRTGASECLDGIPRLPEPARPARSAREYQLRKRSLSLTVQLDRAGRGWGLCADQWQLPAYRPSRRIGIDVSRHRSAKLAVSKAGSVLGKFLKTKK